MNKIFDSNGKMYNIDLPAVSPGKECYIVCPICTSSRQPSHQNEKKLAINMNKSPMMWRCNHCDAKGIVVNKEYLDTAKFKPVVKRFGFMEPSENLVKWFWSERRISEATLKHFDVTMSTEDVLQIKVPESEKHLKGKWISKKCINFKYLKNNILINVKFRDMNKNFKLISGATKTMYNIDSIRGHDRCWIVEGEPDVLAMFEAGIEPVTSVPNGTTITKEEKEHYEKTGKLIVKSALDLSYLDDVIQEFDDKEVIYIATDDDPAGIKLREELARRLGRARCEYVRFSQFFQKDDVSKCKDANDVLIHKGPEFLASIADYAEQYPMEGITTAYSYMESLMDVFDNGYAKGLPTGYKCLDPHFKWVPGWTYTLNGYPGEGKSSLFFNLMAITTILYNFKWGLYCPENYPEHSIVTTLAEIFVGNTANIDINGRMSKEQFKAVIEDHIDKHFFFIKENDKGYTPQQMRDKKIELIKKHGINGFFCDPWKNLNMPFDNGFSNLQRELAAEIRLATTYSLINVIAHHPPTPPRGNDKIYPAPGAMDLVGGQIWAASMFGMLSVHKWNRKIRLDTKTEVHVQKQKIHKVGGIPTDLENPVILKYERRTNRFLETDADDHLSSDAIWTFPIENYFEIKQSTLEGF